MLIKTFAPEPSFILSFNAVMIGYLANLALPRLGEFTRCGVLVKKGTYSFTELFGTVILERVLDLAMLGTITVITIFAQYDLVYDFVTSLFLAKQKHPTNRNYVLIIVISILCLIAVIVFTIVKSKNSKIKNGVQKIIIQFSNGLIAVRKVDKPFLFTIYTLLIWGFYILSAYVCFFSLKATSNLHIDAAFTATIFGSLGMIAPVQGGIGAYHFMVTESLNLYNISKSSGLTYATIVHTSQTLVIIIIGFISLILFFRSGKNHEQLRNHQS